jgi:hypothetical protein
MTVIRGFIVPLWRTKGKKYETGYGSERTVSISRLECRATKIEIEH